MINGISTIFSDGSCGRTSKKNIREAVLIAEYPTWQQAVNSKEFRNVAKDWDNAREKFQNGQIEKLKGLLKECRDEIASIDYNTPVNEREQNELLAKIDEVVK